MVSGAYVRDVAPLRSITVYDPETRSRDGIQFVNIVRAYVDSLERLREQLEAGETGARPTRSSTVDLASSTEAMAGILTTADVMCGDPVWRDVSINGSLGRRVP